MDATKRCPFCAEEILAAAIKCKHCGSMLNGSASAATQEVIRSPVQELIERVPARLEKKLATLLQSGETVCVKLRGVVKEALVCTDRRVLILKTGFMAGHTFGTNVFQVAYRNVTSAQVNSHLITGYLEVSAGGVQNVPTSYWARGNNSPQKRDNCVSLGRRHFQKFQRAAGFIVSNCGR